MGESWPRAPVQTERSEVCTSDWGQDSPIQTDLARLIRCLLYGQTRKQRNKIINNFMISTLPFRLFLRIIYAAFWNLFTLTAGADQDRVLCQLVMFLTVFSTGCTKWNTAAMKSLLLFMAGLFIRSLVEKCVAFGWHRFRFSPYLHA